VHNTKIHLEFIACHFIIFFWEVLGTYLQKLLFLGLEGYHAFITGAAEGIGSQAVREFLGEFGASHKHLAFLEKVCSRERTTYDILN